jgi:uncharacterized membrane protein HdeD (DUF308 family)
VQSQAGRPIIFWHSNALQMPLAQTHRAAMLAAGVCVPDKETEMTTTSATAATARNAVPWWVALILGITYVILGLFLIFQPLISTLLIVIFIGASWFVSGVMDLLSLFRSRERWLWTIISGVIGIWAGLAVLGQPLVGAILVPTVFVIMLAITGIFIGVVRTVQGLQGAGWGMTIWGIVTVLLSGWLLFEPLAGVLVLPFFFGVMALVGGITTIIAAIMGRR